MNRWGWLSHFTAARVALGEQLRTVDWLALRESHAAARDAIAAQPVWPSDAVIVRSQCCSRAEFLVRPGAGRRLHPDAVLPVCAAPPDVALIVADGLSPLAITCHAAAVIDGLRRQLAEFTLAGPIAVEFGRVAIGDEIGERLGAKLAVVLIGERPGLSAADSLGIYLTYDPRVGRTDAERNCLSNIRGGGLSPAAGAARCAWLVRAALSRRLTGVELKEDATAFVSPSTAGSILNP